MLHRTKRLILSDNFLMTFFAPTWSLRISVRPTMRCNSVVPEAATRRPNLRRRSEHDSPRQRHLAGPLAYRLPTPSACGLLCFFDLNRVIPLLRDDHPCAFIAPFAVRVGHPLWLMRDYSPRERPVRPEQRVFLAFIFSLRRTLQPSVLLLSLCGVERIAIAD